MFIRSDNGPEFDAEKVVRWTKDNGAMSAFIEPGAPRQDAYLESSHSRLEEELHGDEFFCSLTEARVVIGAWVDDFNLSRPQRSIGKLTPQEFFEKWRLEDDRSVRLRWQQLLETNSTGLT